MPLLDDDDTDYDFLCRLYRELRVNPRDRRGVAYYMDGELRSATDIIRLQEIKRLACVQDVFTYYDIEQAVQARIRYRQLLLSHR